MTPAKQGNAVVALEEDKAVEGVRAMRHRLAQTLPDYRRAVEAEDNAEGFCRELRMSLRDQRKQMGIDQKSLAERLGMTQSAVSKIESGEGDVGVKTLFRYAHALELRPIFGFIPVASAITGDTGKTAEDFQISLVKETFQKVCTAMTGFKRALK